MLEKNILEVFTIYGHGGYLGHVTRTIYTYFRLPFSRRLPVKFGFVWPSGLDEFFEKCGPTTDGRRGMGILLVLFGQVV